MIDYAPIAVLLLFFCFHKPNHAIQPLLLSACCLGILFYLYHTTGLTNTQIIFTLINFTAWSCNAIALFNKKTKIEKLIINIFYAISIGVTTGSNTHILSSYWEIMPLIISPLIWIYSQTKCLYYIAIHFLSGMCFMAGTIQQDTIFFFANTEIPTGEILRIISIIISCSSLPFINWNKTISAYLKESDTMLILTIISNSAIFILINSINPFIQNICFYIGPITIAYATLNLITCQNKKKIMPYIIINNIGLIYIAISAKFDIKIILSLVASQTIQQILLFYCINIINSAYNYILPLASGIISLIGAPFTTIFKINNSIIYEGNILLLHKITMQFYIIGNIFIVCDILYYLFNRKPKNTSIGTEAIVWIMPIILFGVHGIFNVYYPQKYTLKELSPYCRMFAYTLIMYLILHKKPTTEITTTQQNKNLSDILLAKLIAKIYNTKIKLINIKNFSLYNIFNCINIKTKNTIFTINKKTNSIGSTIHFTIILIILYNTILIYIPRLMIYIQK